MSEKPLYPLQFSPILKEKVWGGTKLTSLLDKKGAGHIGESWEISAVPGSVSIVDTGSLKGKTLQELLDSYGADLVGTKVWKRFGSNFPLLFKFIDAQQDLSIQVHPNDNTAKYRHNSLGKTEMWYILQADPDARLILGFKEGVERSDYLTALENKSLESCMQEVPVQAGDAFYLAAGTVHAIGGGIVLAEIQQSSDITYRIFDWNRPDTNGQMRELHTDQALDVMHFDGADKAVLPYDTAVNSVNELCKAPYFQTNIIPLDGNLTRDYDAIDSFVVLMCTKGSATLGSQGGQYGLKAGDSILIPAQIKYIELSGRDATILEVFVP